MAKGSYFFKFLSILVLITALVSGCNTKDDKKDGNKEKKNTAAKEEKAEDVGIRLAGGKLGSESIAFIGGGISNKIWVLDAKYHKLVSMVEVMGPKKERTKSNYPNLHDVHAIITPKNFSQLITADWFDYDKPSEVIAYDPKTFKELWRSEAGLGGHHGALTPDDKYLYIANQYADTVSVIDMATHKRIKDIKTGMGNDYITPSMYWDGKVIDSPYLFVSVHEGGKVFAIDWKKHEVVKEFTFGGMVHGVNLTPDGSQAWACVMEKNIVPVIDVKKKEVIHRIEFDQSPIHMSFSPDGKFVYITTYGNQIYKYDTKTYKKVWNVTGTSTPAHTGVSPDGKELWTNNHAMDSKRYPYQLAGSIVSGVQVWNTDNGKLISEIPAEGTPHEIQFVPYSALGMRKDPEKEADKEKAEGKDSAAATAAYEKSCLACHGADLGGAAGPNLQKIGGTYKKDEIEEIIMNGKGSMPGGLLTHEDAKKVAEWLAKKK